MKFKLGSKWLFQNGNGSKWLLDSKVNILELISVLQKNCAENVCENNSSNMTQLHLFY